MADVRITHRLNPELNHDCEGIHIEDYELREVVLPATRNQESQRAIAIVIRGRNFRAVAQPLVAYVGDVQVRYLQIAPDEGSIEGVLLEEPSARSFVDVVLGDEDHARHPTPFDSSMIKRIN